MSYINCGATTVTGERFKSKAALKRAMAADPSKVLFYGTAQELGPQLGNVGTVTGNMLDEALPVGTTLVLVGPDPERQRNWYGNVVRKNGVIKIT
jgi:ABC-type histidine transport system ATPase subunit